MENQVFTANPYETAKVEYAGFWIRVGASLIDFLTYIPLMALNFFNMMSIKSLPLQLIILLILGVYKPFMEFKYGGTLGKLAVKIKVVNYELESITGVQAIIRYALWIPGQIVAIASAIMVFQSPLFEETTTFVDIQTLQASMGMAMISGIFGVLILVSCIIVAFEDSKRGLHDMMAKTYVIVK